MTDTQLILVGIAGTAFFAVLMLAVISGKIGDLVNELRYLRGDLQAFKNWELNIGDALLDKVADKFTKKDGKEKKKNGQRKTVKRN